MKFIILHSIDGEPIAVPKGISFEGSNATNTTVWWNDEAGNRHSATVKEKPDEIKEIIERHHIVDLP